MIDVWSSGASDTPIILCALKACDAHADRAVFAKDEITASDAPFLPEQGVSAAIASRAEIPSAAPITKHRLRDALRSSLGELFNLAYKGSPESPRVSWRPQLLRSVVVNENWTLV